MELQLFLPSSTATYPRKLLATDLKASFVPEKSKRSGRIAESITSNLLYLQQLLKTWWKFLCLKRFSGKYSWTNLERDTPLGILMRIIWLSHSPVTTNVICELCTNTQESVTFCVHSWKQYNLVSTSKYSIICLAIIVVDTRTKREILFDDITHYMKYFLSFFKSRYYVVLCAVRAQTIQPITRALNWIGNQCIRSIVWRDRTDYSTMWSINFIYQKVCMCLDTNIPCILLFN